MEEPLQKSLERYDVLDRIAVGGMAEVFLAKAYGAHGFEKTLAIKRILPELAQDPEFEARFIAEAKVAVRLSHANVVQVFDFGRMGASLFIAMEFVDGLDLAAMLRKFKDEGRQVPLPAAFHIAIEIMRALDFAHGHNVVHRDVSPSNILISRAGEVKIADFGIAVAAQPHKHTAPGLKRVMGKWRYMSPEQTRGDTLDTRSDLFSAASVIYELFTNEKLFPGDEAEQIIKNIHEMPIPRMTAIRPNLPSRLDELLAAPLARKPIDRPTRPAQVLRGLIELSYESSIMATALDVAEALATVIPAKRLSGQGALDALILKELAEQSVARRTAVTDGKPPPTELPAGEVSTGLFRKVDMDGLSRLEEVEVGTQVTAPRPRRASPHGLAPAYEASQDPDRHTEVGGPPTGAVPKLGDSAVKGPPKARAPGGHRLIWAALALAALAGGGTAIWALTRTPEVPRPQQAELPPPPPPPEPDARAADPLGTFEIYSIPPGAEVTIAGQPQGPAPRTANVSSGVQIRVRLELKGYQMFEEDYVAEPNKTTVIRERLMPAPATLSVETTPAGAQVTAGGQALGLTPFARPIGAGKGVEIVISKAGYEPVKLAADLTAGETTSIRRELREAPKFGFVTINVSGTAGWADVYVRNQNLGRNRTASGLVPFKLPVGTHALRLRTGNGKTKTVNVTVAADKTSAMTASFD
ncbi:MAG TPA: serine/threonine-protein kinase [Kofleriaceae bacterium]|nr:serine/threonine-protein kinase [Kofleriaceae bacterium]